MVDVLPKTCDGGDPWSAGYWDKTQTHPLLSSSSSLHNEYERGSSVINNRGRNEYSNRDRSHQGRGRGHWNRHSSGSQYIPAPRLHNPPRKKNYQYSGTRLNQNMLGECLAEFKCYPTMHPDTKCRPFHGGACACLPFSVVSTAHVFCNHKE
ncbi:hypothetical protein Pcinc_029019 [Petrolisthes cinctipes]|uniref:Uncharacterized protein n=1 Tax=Petrolisthes cinctipes TaxID=88211 RepID=A0AAE1K8H5_PETCI|nr:hypothetical protein Pcinc_033467 [Petrolisthes cinctipes]KAK3865375.1 hypothetical protein Pcinc_029019 [Petrolisthes cinctipes]